MEETNTVEISGTEFNADDLAEALDALGTDTPKNEYAFVGDVVVTGDGFDDSDIEIGTAATFKSGDSIPHITENLSYMTVETAKDRVEAAQQTSFEEFVEEEFWQVTPVEGKAFSGEALLDVTTTQDRQVVGSATGSALDESDDVEIKYISYNGGEKTDDTLRIGLNDTRNE